MLLKWLEENGVALLLAVLVISWHLFNGTIFEFMFQALVTLAAMTLPARIFWNMHKNYRPDRFGWWVQATAGIYFLAVGIQLIMSFFS